MDTLKMISFSQNNLKGEIKHQDIIRSLNKEVLDVHISDFKVTILWYHLMDKILIYNF